MDASRSALHTPRCPSMALPLLRLQSLTQSHGPPKERRPLCHLKRRSYGTGSHPAGLNFGDCSFRRVLHSNSNMNLPVHAGSSRVVVVRSLRRNLVVVIKPDELSNKL